MSIKDEWVELVGKSIAASAKDAQSKSPDELTNEEKFALAIMAGCETEFVSVSGGWAYRLKNPIAISKIDGQFIVSERR